MFRVEIETSNAAFKDKREGDNGIVRRVEISRILREIARMVENNCVEFRRCPAFASNGNKVGIWGFYSD